jgi:hypothetical protein
MSYSSLAGIALTAVCSRLASFRRLPRRNCGRRELAQLGAKSEEQRLVVRESHAVRLPRMPLYLRDELVLVFGAGLEAAVAMKHPVRHLENDAR